MLKKYLRYSYLILVMILILCGIYFNLSVYSGPELSNNYKTKLHVLRQLIFLEREMHQHQLAEQMQQIYPEGYVFSNAIYGLTWCQVVSPPDFDIDGEAIRVKKDSNRINAMNEAIWAFQQIDSDLGKRTFPRETNGPDHGVYYCGWRNYLLGKIVLTFPDCPNELKELHKQYSKEIATAFDSIDTPFPDSYPGDAWPCDAAACMASINLVYEYEYKNLSKKWIEQVKTRLIQPEGLVSSRWRRRYEPETEFIRGSASVLNIRFLEDVDPVFAREQFERFRPHFETTILNMPAIREFPDQYSGSEDIDSGPVIFDVGFAATLCGIGTYKSMGRRYEDAANHIFHSVHAFGCTKEGKDGGIAYLRGELPMADLFIAWGLSTQEHPAFRDQEAESTDSIEFGGRSLLHFYSLLIIGGLLLPIFVIKWQRREN